MVGTVTLRISHGYEVREDNDPFINLAENVVQVFEKTAAQGTYLVDLIPIRMLKPGVQRINSNILVVQYLPEWFPGAGFKTQARQWKEEILQFADWPLELVKTQMVSYQVG